MTGFHHHYLATRKLSLMRWSVLITLLSFVSPLSAAVQQVWRISPGDTGVATGLGWALDISGQTIIAGAPADGEVFPYGGAAYLIDVATGQIKHRLSPSQSTLQGIFGIKVAIEGNRALVGAPVQGAMLGTDIFEEVDDPGSAYIFDVQTGQELYRLTPDDSSSLDYFGGRVAISGNLAVVTAFQNDYAGEDAGAAYVFDLTTGQQLRKIIPSDAHEQQQFGISLAVEGNLAVIGTLEETVSDNYAGSAYVFDITTGEELYKLAPSVERQGVWFARSVALSNSIALIGAPEWRYDNSMSPVGFADYYDVETGQWLGRFDSESDEQIDNFGYAVALDGQTAIVSSPGESLNGVGKGVLHYFNLESGELVDIVRGTEYQGRLEVFGISVALENGYTVVNGLEYNDSEQQIGYIHLYRDVPEPGSLCIMVGGLAMMCRSARRLGRSYTMFHALHPRQTGL